MTFGETGYFCKVQTQSFINYKSWIVIKGILTKPSENKEFVQTMEVPWWILDIVGA